MNYPDGANVVILDALKRILVVRHNYGTKLWGLPGGKIEPNENSIDTAVRETFEETSLIIRPENMELLAQCTQRRGSCVSLYLSSQFEGNLVSTTSDEILLARFMSFREVVYREAEFGTGYLRMIIMYMRYLHGVDKPVIKRFLYDPIEFSSKF